MLKPGEKRGGGCSQHPFLRAFSLVVSYFFLNGSRKEITVVKRRTGILVGVSDNHVTEYISFILIKYPIFWQNRMYVYVIKEWSNRYQHLKSLFFVSGRQLVKVKSVFVRKPALGIDGYLQYVDNDQHRRILSGKSLMNSCGFLHRFDNNK